MARVPLITILLFHFLCTFILATSVADDNILTAYEIIQGYNFPVGILPKGVTGYDIDRSTGKFHVFLNDTCSFSLEGSYKLKYKSTISGSISANRIRDLSGISVKVLFLWLNIVEVVRSEDELQFSVGIASADFPIDNFFDSPQCGCGLICVTDDDFIRTGRDRSRFRPFASSF